MKKDQTKRSPLIQITVIYKKINPSIHTFCLSGQVKQLKVIILS